MIHPAERADARANRGRLIAAAHAVFRERGLDAEMKEIAERAGLGVGTIYRNFPTKEDLVAAILMEAIGEMQRGIEECARIDDPVAAVRQFLALGLAINERYGSILLAMLGGTMPVDCAEEFSKLKEEDHISTIVRKGMARGIFRADIDPDIAAAQITGAFVPWTYQELRQTRTPEQIADGYLNLILRGIRAAD
jgi:AcrR family transcriptional regulator